MDFEKINLLYLIIPVVILWFLVHNSNDIGHLFTPNVLAKISVKQGKISTKTRLRLMLLAMILILIAFSKPTLNGAEIEVESYFNNLVVAIDLSKSMQANDIHPNRFEFAKNRLLKSLEKIRNRRIAIISFATKAFLTSPFTEDFSGLKPLIKSLSADDIQPEGTNILNSLQIANNLFDKNSNKQLLLLTDGGDNTDFKKEISYANKENIHIFIFDIASKEGSSIPDGNGLLNDNDNGDIVHVSENPNIKNLSAKTKGGYLKYSLNENDLSDFINSFEGNFDNKKTKIYQKQQLFYFPLALAITLLFMAFFSLPKKL